MNPNTEMLPTGLSAEEPKTDVSSFVNRRSLAWKEPPKVLNKPESRRTTQKNISYAVQGDERSKLPLSHPQPAHGGRMIGRLHHVLEIARLDREMKDVVTKVS